WVARVPDRLAEDRQALGVVAVDHLRPALGPEDERVEDDVVRDAELLAQGPQMFPGLGRAPVHAEPAGQEETGGGQRLGVPAPRVVDDLTQQPFTALRLARLQ